MMSLTVSNLIYYNDTLCSTDWEVPSTVWPFYRLYFVYSGEVIYKSQEECFNLEKNFFYIFPVNKKYSMTQNVQDPLHCMWFHVNLNCTLLNNAIKFDVEPDTTRFYLIKALDKLVKCKADIGTTKGVLNALLSELSYNEQSIYALDQYSDKSLRYLKKYQTSERFR